jgi:hypothetical protein
MKKIITALLFGFVFVPVLALGATKNVAPKISYTISMKNTSALVEVSKDRKLVDSFTVNENDENLIIIAVADEENVSYKEARKLSTFTYPTVKAKDALNLVTDKVTFSSSVKGGFTIINVNADGQTSDYWIKSTNIKTASDKLARVLKLNKAHVYKLLSVQ